MKIKNYIKLVNIIFLFIIILISCTNNQSSTSKSGYIYEEYDMSIRYAIEEYMRIVGGSVYLRARVSSPYNISKVEASIYSDKSEEEIKYNLHKCDEGWDGIIADLSTDSEKSVVLNAYDSNDQLLYTGKAYFFVQENNVSTVFVKLNEVTPKIKSNAFIESVILSNYKVAPGETISLNANIKAEHMNDELTFQWSSKYGTFDDINSESPKWTAPPEDAKFLLTVFVKDSNNNLDHLLMNMRVDSQYAESKLANGDCNNETPSIKSIKTTPGEFIQGEFVKLSVEFNNDYNCQLEYKWWTSCYQGSNCDNNYGKFSNHLSSKPIFIVNKNAPIEQFMMNVKVCNNNNCTYESKKVQIYKCENNNLEIIDITANPKSIKPGGFTRLNLSIKTDCHSKPYIYDGGIHHKCHNNCCHKAIEYLWNSSCPGSFDNNQIMDPVFTAAPRLTVESCNLTVLVNNGHAQVSDSIKISILQENSKPIIKSLFASKSEVVKNDNINVSVVAEDPDGDNLNYLWTSNCSGSFNNTTLKDAVFTVSSNPTHGSCSITIKVDDGKDDVIASKIIIVKEQNNTPMITKLYANKGTLDHDDYTGVEVEASDPDGDSLAYKWSTTCEGLMYNDTNSKSLFVAESDAQYGICTIDIEVSDGKDKVFKSLTIEIMETQSNTPPLIYSMDVDPKEGYPGDSVNLQVYAHDIDMDVITYEWSTTCSGEFDDTTITDPVFTISEDTAQGGHCLFKIIIDDGEIQTYGFVAFEILKENNEPEINMLSANPENPGLEEVVHLQVDASDSDGDALSYWWTTNCNGSFNDPSLENPEFTVASDADFGQCMISVEVSDAIHTVTGTTNINITEPFINVAPAIISSFQTTDIINNGGQILFIVRANDPEGTDLSFDWFCSMGTFDEPVITVTDDYSESFVSWTAPDCGIDSIEIKVNISDADGGITEKKFLPIMLINGVECP